MEIEDRGGTEGAQGGDTRLQGEDRIGPKRI